MLPFLGSVISKDWVHRVGHSPVCQILLQIVVREMITSSSPAWASFAGMLLTPADFPFFNDCTAASTSLWRMGWSSSVCVRGYFSTDESPLAFNWFSIGCSSVRHFPERSWTEVAFFFSLWSSLSRVGMPFYSCSSANFHQSSYTVLLSSFLLPFSCTSWCHCSLPCISQIPQVLFFLSSLLLSHRSRISAVTQFFFFLWWRLPSTLLAVSVTAVLKVVIIVSMSVS